MDISQLLLVITSGFSLGVLILLIKLFGTIIVNGNPLYYYEKDNIEYHGFLFFIRFILAPFIIVIYGFDFINGTIDFSRKILPFIALTCITYGIIGLYGELLENRSWSLKRFFMLFTTIIIFDINYYYYSNHNYYILAYCILLTLMIMIFFAMKYALFSTEKIYANITLKNREKKINNCEIVKMYPDFIYISK